MNENCNFNTKTLSLAEKILDSQIAMLVNRLHPGYTPVYLSYVSALLLLIYHYSSSKMGADSVQQFLGTYDKINHTVLNSLGICSTKAYLVLLKEISDQVS